MYHSANDGYCSAISEGNCKKHAKKQAAISDLLCAPQVGLEPTTTRLTAECSAIELLRNMESGSDLSSRAVSSQVLSALKGLTSVFGMGTGGTPSSLPPEMVAILFRKPLSLCPDNCTSNDSLSDLQLISFFVLHLCALQGSCSKSSPRPISINNLHVLPHFQR